MRSQTTLPKLPRRNGVHSNLGGGREALRPESKAPATDNPDVAAKLCTDRVTELTEKRKNRGLGIVEKDPQPGLCHYGEYHLKQKKRDRECTDAWIRASEHHLKLACAFFGEDRPLDVIDPEDLTQWVNHLRQQKGRKGGKLTETSIRKALNRRLEPVRARG